MSLPRDDHSEFLRMDDFHPRPYMPSDNVSESSPFHTLWTEFARSHPRLSPPRSPVLPHARSASTFHPRYDSHAEQPQSLAPPPAIDLRALEYSTDYDTNLMCPICHVPFVDPIVLDCDHTFCGDCFDTYHNSGSGSDRSRCPACRAYHLGGPRRANRLIRNMASEVRVKCPNLDCEVIVPRSGIARHAMKECPEQELLCPQRSCTKQTKRRNFIPDLCTHESHTICSCGGIVGLGPGDMLQHKDEGCPDVETPLYHTLSDLRNTEPDTCPGSQYGCSYHASLVRSDEPDLPAHTSTCVFARLSPILGKQAALLSTLQQSLDQQTQRNRSLESALTRMSDMITHTIQPRLDHLTAISPNRYDAHYDDTLSEIEEIPRSPSSLQQTLYQQHQTQHEPSYAQPDPALTQTLSNLMDRVSYLENQHQTHTSETHRALRDMDARTSLSLMNETLRIREELAHLNGGMYSTRAQVTYLLNHHRLAGQQAAMSGVSNTTGAASSVTTGIATASNLTRGLANAVNTITGTGTGSASAQPNSTSTSSDLHNPAIPSTSNQAPLHSSVPVSHSLSSSSSTTGTSPNLNPNPLFSSATRPNLRRGSGGSASGSRSSIDRVKL